jgi:energy-coupling factor transporter ATP-binding protein EcfA2
MILKSLRVERFGGLNPGAEIGEFGSAFTVIHGPNEAGKSTLLRALTYALYQRHKVSARELLEQAIPVGTSLSPRIVLGLDLEGTTWRVEKTFGKSASALLSVTRNGVFEPVAQNADADEKLRELLGNAFAARGMGGAELRGMGEIFIADQGALRLARDLGARTWEQLKEVVGEVASTDGTNALLERARKRYLEVFTEGGKLKEASEHRRLEQELADAQELLERVKGAAAEVEGLEAQLFALIQTGPDLLGEEEARLEAELKGAREAWFEYGRKAAEVDQAQARARAVAERAERAQERSRRFSALGARKAEVVERRGHFSAQQASLQGQLEEARKELEQIDAELRSGGESILAVERKKVELDDAEAARRSAAAVSDRRRRLARWEELGLQSDEVERRIAARARPSSAQLSEIRKHLDQAARLEAALETLRLRVRITPEKALQVRQGEQVHSLQAGEARELAGAEPFVLEIPGVGRLELMGPASEERAQKESALREVRSRLETLCAPFGTGSLPELERLAAERQELEGERRSFADRRRELFPSPEAERTAKEELSHEERLLEALQGRHPEWAGEVPGEALVASLRSAFEDARRRVEEDKRTKDKLRRGQLQSIEQLTQGLKAKEKELTSCEVELAKLDHELERLGGEDGGPSAWGELLRGLEVEARESTEATRRLSEELVLLGNPGETIARLERGLKQVRDDRQKLGEKRAGLESRLEDRRRQGLYQQRVESEERVEQLGRSLEREKLASEALRKLYETLREEQKKGTEALAEPVTRRMTRLLRSALGSPVELSLGQGLLPEQLTTSEGRAFNLGQLSCGTQDQVALLTRLALGELYAQTAGRHAFVLDDPLVNTDAGRRNRMLDVLTRATEHLQLVVFTCHPEHYRGLKDAVYVSLEDARGRVA